MNPSIAVLLTLALAAGPAPPVTADRPAPDTATPPAAESSPDSSAATPSVRTSTEPSGQPNSADEADSRVLVIQPAVVTLIEQVEVPARVAGVLAEVAVREGTFVEQGELLARLVDDEAQLNLHMAGLELRIARRQADNDIRVRFAKKSAEVAAAELRRSLDSVRRYRKSISDTEIDRLRLSAEQARLEIEQSDEQFAEAKLTAEVKDTEEKLARLELVRSRIEAPLSGVVVQLNRRAGEWVKPGDPVVRILRVNRLRAEGFVPASRINGRHAGLRVELSIAVPEGEPRVFHGKLVFVSPEVNPVSGQVRVWAEIDNPDLVLRPGEKGTMTIRLPADPPSRNMARAGAGRSSAGAGEVSR